jgi:hypothetical protein
MVSMCAGFFLGVSRVGLRWGGEVGCSFLDGGELESQYLRVGLLGGRGGVPHFLGDNMLLCD